MRHTQPLITSGSFFVGVERGTSSPSPEPDPEAPLLEHESHAFDPREDADRWRECAACGVRDYWRASTLPCAGSTDEGEGEIAIDVALERILEDLAAFRAWWVMRGFTLTRPSVAEWRAELFEWSRENCATPNARRARAAGR